MLLLSHIAGEKGIQSNLFNTDTKGTEPSLRFYRGVHIIELCTIFGISGPNELSVMERCPYYRGVCKERLDCVSGLYRIQCRI